MPLKKNRRIKESDLRSNHNLHTPKDVHVHAGVVYGDARQSDARAQEHVEDVFDELERKADGITPRNPDDGGLKMRKTIYTNKISLDESLFESVSDENPSEIAKFLKDSVEWLVDEDRGCTCYKLDDRLGICVGWQDGYDADDSTVIHSASAPTYAIVAGIKVYTSDGMRTDYDWINYPYFANGDVYDASASIGPDENYGELAKFFIKEFDAMEDWEIEKDGLVIRSDDGEEDAVEESCKGKKGKKRKKIGESKKLNEGTSNFWSMKKFPLLVFMPYEDVYDRAYDMTVDELGYNDDDIVDTPEFDKNFDDASQGVVTLDETEVERLRDDIDSFNNSELYNAWYELINTKDEIDFTTDGDEDARVELKDGYYEGSQIFVPDEKYLADWQVDMINVFLKTLKEKYGLTKLGVSYRASNGETGYHKIGEGKTAKESMSLEEKKGQVEDLDDNVFQLVYDALFIGNKNYRPQISQVGVPYDWEHSLIGGGLSTYDFGDYDIGVTLSTEDEGARAKDVAEKLKLKYEVRPTNAFRDGTKFIGIIRIPDATATQDATEYVTSIGLSMDDIRPKKKKK